LPTATVPVTVLLAVSRIVTLSPLKFAT